MARVLLPLPAVDFDPTEVAVPSAALRAAGHDVVFATPDGTRAAADPRMVTGEGLGPWRGVLRADARGRAAYDALVTQAAFAEPVSYAAAWKNGASAYDALLLPGGHAPGMRAYLESSQVHAMAAGMMAADKPVAAICHGVVALARATGPGGHSVLHGRHATALLARQELLAWGMTALWLGRYYRTYDETVEAEVRRALGPGTFESGQTPLFRDGPHALGRGFVVQDEALLTARWPGDAHAFAAALCAMLAARSAARA